MGPPLKAAENEDDKFEVRRAIYASMGPPLKAAEKVAVRGGA